jgi:flagellar hook assembly protein FlgD
LVKGWSLENQSRGEHKLFWDATNASGELVSTGVYLGIIKTEGYQSTIKMVLLR